VNGKPLLGDEAAALSQISATVAAEWAKGELTVTVLRAPAAGGEAGSSGALAVARHAEVEAEAGCQYHPTAMNETRNEHLCRKGRRFNGQHIRFCRVPGVITTRRRGGERSRRKRPTCAR